jgi:WD40 repeat protein
MHVKTLSRRLLQAATLLLCTFNLAHAGEPPTEPILRFDLGEHTGMIRKIASDAEGRWLVTASDDKTARVWDLRDGRLLSTLRIPIGAGSEGKLFAVALSQDGQTVALGGWTGWDYDGGSASIYLLDRASGRLLRRITGMSDTITCLSFSPDGRTLAVSMNGKSGLRLFSVADGRLLAQDTDYGAASFSVAFSHDGRFVTTSDDGYLRLYRFDSSQLSLLAKRSVPIGKEPFAARFSPDGTKIAVGLYDATAVNVLNAADLSFNYALDTTGLSPNLDMVSWSRNGDFLYAAGTSQKQFDGLWQRYVRRWSIPSNGTPSDWPVAGDSITDLAPLSSGRLLFASGEPSWGIVNEQGQRTLFHAPVITDFRDNFQSFTLAYDASKVGFGNGVGGKSLVVFDIQSKSFLTTSTPGLNSPVTFSTSGINITDWQNTLTPKFNGKPISLLANERSRSYAFLPNGSGFILGTEYSLRLFDINGNQRWRLPVPGAAWSVNVSQDGRWIVAAYGDGTIRWHRVSDGAEQLAFFPHADKKRWVMWTPSGYYDASPGAESMIGWHVNNGKDKAADFFPASRFRERFNRPDVLSKILETQDETAALQLANQESGRKQVATTSIVNVLPPVVDIISPASDSTVKNTTVKLRYNVRTLADAPVTGIRVRVNGQAVSAERALKLKTSTGEGSEVEVTIPEQDSEIQLFAESKNGVSVPAILRVTWAGKIAAPSAEDNLFKPKLYVLAVGVSKYKNPDFNLGLAAKDAKDFAAVLQKQKGKLYADVVVKLLTDDNATRDDVVDGLDWLKQQVTSRDVGMMFVAGHGLNDNQGNYYFLPHNADPDKLLRTGVAQGDIRSTLNSLAGKAVFFVDTCHAGNALGTSKTRAIGGSTDAFINELSSAENGVVVFSSSTGKQLSQENPAWGNGAFTKAVVEGLGGKADFAKNGKITHKGLDYYVTERVKELTKGQQSPVSISPSGVTDFPIAVVNSK